MKINDVIFNVELIDILSELKSQLNANGREFLNKMNDTPDNIMVCCPYHKNGQERKPSAGIHKSDGIFHCFSCGEVHSLPEVISHCFGRYEDLIGKFGWQWLLKNFVTVQAEERKSIQLDLSRNNYKEKCDYVTEEELDSYRYIHPYMYERKLTNEIIEMFDVGYDAATKSITFPVKDISGNCLFIARRLVESKFFNYPSGVEKPLYGLYEFVTYSNSIEVIVCESMIDALTCWVYGRPAVALNGLGNKLAINQLKQLNVRKIILATDNDKAGKQARIRLKDELNNKLVTEFDYNSYPKNAKDINDMTREQFLNLIEIF